MLISLARQVELKNIENPYCPVGLTDYLRNLHNDLLAHMEKEEQILFPFLSDEKMSYIFTQVSLAMHNHDHEIHMLSKIDELTNRLTLPENADKEWKILYFELTIFKADLLEHIRLENDILFDKYS
jgi:regulator of cell morphogenesis and NO signaling